MTSADFVKGALDPTCATPEQRDTAVQQILRNGRPDRAAAFIRGWVEYHGGDAPVLAWHRQLGNVTVRVGRAS